jgi:hypothetical protein
MLVSVAASIIFHNLQARQEKVEFENAEKDLSKIYSQIVSDVGVPYKGTSDKYCAYRTVKFSYEGRYCLFRKELYYELSGDDAGNNITQKIVSSIAKNNEVTNLKINSSDSSAPEFESYQFSLRKQFECTLGVLDIRDVKTLDRFTYNQFILPESSWANVPAKSIYLQCLKNSVTEHYQYRNS